MDIDSHASRRFRSSCIGILLGFFLMLQPAAAGAAEPRPPLRGQVCVMTTPLLAEAWHWRNLFHPVQSALSNRRRMIQFATIGMCIGLYILMRK